MKFCSISSGSSGNCIFAGTSGTSVLIDVGISGIRVERGLNEIDITTRDVDAILVTHEHADHIKGLGVLARRYGIPIYSTEGTIRAIKDNTSVGKIPEGLMHVIRADQEFMVGDITIRPFEISHDAAEPVGFRMEHEGKSAAVATDLGCYDDYTVKYLTGKRRILSEHGHLSNETAGQLLGTLLHDNVKHVFLGHLSQENNYEALAYETVCQEVTMGDNPYSSGDFNITIAHRDRISESVIW